MLVSFDVFGSTHLKRRLIVERIRRLLDLKIRNSGHFYFFYYNRKGMIYELSIYKPHSGKPPFEKWLSSLKDKKTKQIIQARIDRAVFGNLGDIKGLGDDVFEFRIDYGPGFRVYFSIQGQKILLLLVGGDKRTQNKDIEKAKLYLKEWKSYE